MNQLKLTIRQITPDDWPIVAEIYKQGIETGDATFQQEIPSWMDWNNTHLKNCRIVALVNGEIAGWAALTAVSSRCVYAGVAEVSLYIANNYRGQKVGTSLLEQLIIESEKENLWTLQAGIFPENIPSLIIHERAGFRKIGYRERIGKMNNIWRDTILMERRSKNIGLD